MTLTNESYAAKIEGKVTGAIRPYRKSPGEKNGALYAGVQTAQKLEEDIVVIEGNSFMNKVYHLARATESVSKFTGMPYAINVFVCKPNGKIYRAEAV